MHVISSLGSGSIPFSRQCLFRLKCSHGHLPFVFQGCLFSDLRAMVAGFYGCQTTCQGRRRVVGTGVSLISGTKMNTTNTVLSLRREDGTSVQKSVCAGRTMHSASRKTYESVMQWADLKKMKIQAKDCVASFNPYVNDKISVPSDIGKGKGSGAKSRSSEKK